mgnify:CR=1
MKKGLRFQLWEGLKVLTMREIG